MSSCKTEQNFGGYEYWHEGYLRDKVTKLNSNSFVDKSSRALDIVNHGPSVFFPEYGENCQ
jgi:hypothetical protein